MVNFLIEKHNLWWIDKGLIEKDIVLFEFYQQKYQFYHPLLEKIPDKEGVFTIRGPRRIGKTTLLKLMIKKLIFNYKINPKNIFFYPCDRISDYNQLYDLITIFLGKKEKGLSYIFLDEISFVFEWQRTIKNLWDAGDLKNTVIFLTGSNALDLKFSGERLVGRRGNFEKTDINYYPLSFSDIYKLTQKKAKIEDYFLTGGFPQTINDYFKNKIISNYFYETFLQWIEGDLHKIGKSEKYFYQISQEIINHLGSTVSWYKIAKNIGIGSHTTVQEYLDILEKIFVYFYLHFYDINQKKIFLNKNKKIYFFDPIIFHSINAKINGLIDQYFFYAKEILEEKNFLSKFIENIVGLFLKKNCQILHYGHYQNKEVDYVILKNKKLFAVEIKYQNSINISDFYFWKEKIPLIIITKNFNYKKNFLWFISLENFLSQGIKILLP